MRDYFFVFDIEDTSFQNDIIKLIDNSEDEMNHTTNVKAKSTSYSYHKKNEFQPLRHHIIRCVNQLTKLKYNIELEYKIVDMWGMCYESNDYAIPHHHWPATWATVYYINPPKDSPGLYFEELDKEFFPKNGNLIVFPGWVIHEVKRKEFEGKRYAVASNLLAI